MPPIVTFVGLSNSGKTTLIEKIIRELRRRGYRVASVKHAGHGTSLDEEGKDSWRHVQAGSEATILYSRDRALLIKPVPTDIALEDLVKMFSDGPDIIIAEGFKRGETPKIEVHRREVGPQLYDIMNLLAIVTNEPLDTKLKQFSLDDYLGVTDFVVERFLKK